MFGSLTLLSALVFLLGKFSEFSDNSEAVIRFIRARAANVNNYSVCDACTNELRCSETRLLSILFSKVLPFYFPLFIQCFTRQTLVLYLALSTLYRFSISSIPCLISFWRRYGSERLV